MKVIYLLLAVLALGACVTVKPEVEKFTVDLDSRQIEIGEIEAQFDKLFSIGGLRKAAVKVTYYPQYDAVCLQYKSDLITYYQCWNREGREAFIKALERYNEDYNEKKLDRNARRSKELYGTIEGYLVWQLHRYAIRAKANMDVQLGYAFKDRSPYYTVYQRQAEYIDPIARDNNRTSDLITIFFTRTQAEGLAVLFDEQFLYGLAAPGNRIIPDYIEKDDY